MDVYRFDPEVSIPVTQFGSAFRLAPLTGADARGRVQVMHLAPGGVIGRHPTALRQLFAVVAGSGWASGGDGQPRDLRPGIAVVWEPGEEHDVRTDGGLTALSVEGAFDMRALRVTKDIVVADYDPAWPEWFARIRDVVWPAVKDRALRIEHVGSTAVPGIAAKPVIDVDIVVATADDVPAVIECLATIGYRWRGDLGVEGREAFAPRDDALPRHHLYAVVDGSGAYLDHVLLRDLLRGDATQRDRYGGLKRRNAELARGDMEVYVAAKADLVSELLAEARRAAGRGDR